MRSVVPGEGGVVCKALAAHVTLVRSVAEVRVQVLDDGTALQEPALTDGAFERFFSAVGPQVGCEVGPLGEGLLADGALVGFFAIVEGTVRL